MQLDLGDEKPIYIQLAEMIEDNILRGIYEEETQIPSTTEVAVTLKVNPATVNRGVNLLVNEGLIYKQRGVGMFVSTGAREIILAKRRQAFIKDYLLPLLEESRNLGLSQEDLIEMIKQSASIKSVERRNPDEHH